MEISKDELLKDVFETETMLMKTLVMLQRWVSKILEGDECYRSDRLAQDFFDRHQKEFVVISEKFINVSYHSSALSLRRAIYLDKNDEHSKEDLQHGLWAAHGYIVHVGQSLAKVLLDEIEEMNIMLENAAKPAKAFH